MDNQSRGLIRKKDIFVLVNDVQGAAIGKETGFFVRFSEKLVVNVKLKYIAFRKTVGKLGFFAVYLNPFKADIFVNKCGG